MLTEQSFFRPWGHLERRGGCLVLAAFLFSFVCIPAKAQPQVTIGTPIHRTGTGFYENFGVGWNYWNDDFFINVPNGVRPPFGLGAAGSDAQLGFGFYGPNGGRGAFQLTMGQGSYRTRSTVTPMLTLPNGGTGALFHGTYRPFVTGWIPVVGDYGPVTGWAPQIAPVHPMGISPLQQKLAQMAAEGGFPAPNAAGVAPGGPRSGKPQGGARTNRAGSSRSSGQRRASVSSAERGDISVAEIRRQQAAEDPVGTPAEFQIAARQAASLEAEGKLYSARNQYERAARQAPQESRSTYERHVDRLTRLIETRQKPSKSR